MPVSATNPVSLATAASTTPVLPVKTLGQSDFLKLLATQMTSQDPMNPQTDTNFIAQMAQFSALQATTAMQQNLAQMGAQQQFMQATALLGQTVGLQVPSSSTPLQGVVTAVQVVDGTPKIVVNGAQYDLSQVLTVSPTVNH